MSIADPEDIQDIVRRARLGDADAFAQLYTSYFTPLYRYIYFRISDKAHADDLTQDVFLKAYASFGKYVHSGDSPLPYFYTIARNSIVDHYRKRKSVLIDEDQMHNIPDTISLEDDAADREDLQLIQRQILQLPQDQQDAIVLRFINGLSNKEIAKMLKKSEVTVRQLQSRGMKTIRASLASKYAE